MKYLISILFFILVQNNTVFSQGISVSEEPGITALMNKYLSKNQVEESVKAWRIQIIATSDRREMQSTKAKFSNLYPHIDLDWKHVAPYYKVAVGAWRDKLSCNAFLGEMKRNFPLAIPVVDNIRKEVLLK